MRNDENLYKIVKDKICDRIYEGYHENGDRIPSERELAERMDVSRVTIRRALTELEGEGLIQREVGRGTRVTFHNCGHPGEADMIVLIAPARNPFFSRFIQRFQDHAEKKGALLLYVEKPRKEMLEDCLYRLYKRGLRNVVVWLEDIQPDPRKLERLRALGMNMVFFDSDQGLPYADCVALDNRRAVSALYGELERKGCRKIGYIGWDALAMYSIREREEAYREKTGGKGSQMLCRISWQDKEDREQIIAQTLWQRRERLPDGVICGDGEIGAAVSGALGRSKICLRIGAVDEFSKDSDGDAVLYRQDLDTTVERIFACLEEQCGDGGDWKADLYRVEGMLCR